MVQILVILAFLSLHVGEFTGDSAPLLPVSLATSVAIILAPLLLFWIIAHAICLRAARTLDATGEVAFAIAAERAVGLLRSIGGLQFAASSSTVAWFALVADRIVDLPAFSELLAVAPLLVFIAALWWSFAPIDRRLRDARLMRQLRQGEPVHRPPTRLEYVSANFRHQVLLILIPLVLLSAWRDALRQWGDHLPFLPPLSSGAASWATLALDLLGVALVFVFTPALIRLAWDTVPISSGPFHDTLDSMCRLYRVRMRTPLLWRTYGSMVNGAVLGLVWPFRYLMFTDALFDRLTARQVEGVAAHEVGHIKRHHIFWLAISIFAAVTIGESLGLLLAWLLRANTHTMEGLVISASIASVAFAFGWVSRRFEWQADAFAVQHLSRAGDPLAHNVPPSETVTSESINAMASALLDVALVNGMNPNAFTFRHGSIAARVRRLHDLLGTPVHGAPIDRHVRILKWSAASILLLGIAASFVLQLFDIHL
jgi:Zn-dependent protease with chaperone function